jgi:DNA helicase-2/ATP-dependent DNA helicase PcrA
VLKFDNYKLSGKIDRVDKLETGKYEIIDYKTGRPREEKLLTKDLQLKIYALAVSELWGFAVEKVSLLFVTYAKKVSVSFDKNLKDSIKSEIQYVVDGIRKYKFPPSPGFRCKYCDFRNICNFVANL